MRRFLILLFCSLLPDLAAAHSVSEEVGAGTSQATPRFPRSSFIYDRVGGLVEASEDWSFQLAATLTHDQPIPPPRGARFATSPANVLFLEGGVEWNPNAHLLFGGELNYSPSSSFSTNARVTYNDAGGSPDTNALLVATSSSVGMLLNAAYETNGDSNFETGILGSVSLTDLRTTQAIDAIETSTGPVTAAQLLDRCARHPANVGCKQIVPALESRSADLLQCRLSAGVVETLFTNNEVGLDAAVYLYNQDPTQVGYFSVATAGKTATSFGSGVALAPLRYTLRPQLARQWGKLRLELWYQYARYVDGEGYANLLGVKVAYRFNSTFRIWVATSGQQDIAPQNDVNFSGTLALGLRVRF